MQNRMCDDETVRDEAYERVCREFDQESAPTEGEEKMEEEKKTDVPLLLYETCDMDKARALIANKRFNPLYKRFLVTMYTACQDYGGLEVKYRYGKHTRKNARLYADRGYQNAPKALRRVVMEDWHWGFDIVNSVPFFLWWLTDQLAGEQLPSSSYSALRAYVLEREKVLHEVQQEMRVGRETAKKVMLKLTHGGMQLGNMADADSYPTTKAYRAAVQAAANFLGKNYFKKLWATCQREKGKVELVPGSGCVLYDEVGRFVHYLATRYEAVTMRTAMEFFRDVKGCAISTLVHDELVVSDRENKLGDDKAAVLAELGAYIRKHAEYPGVQVSGKNVLSMRVGGKLVPLPVIKPPVILHWTCSQMVEQPGDLHSLLLPEPGASNGCENTRFYRTPEDMCMAKNGKRVLHPIVFDKYPVQCINAWTGMGKTNAAFDAVYKLRAEKPDAMILWVTGRKTQATSSGNGLRGQCRSWIEDCADEVKDVCEQAIAMGGNGMDVEVLKGILRDIVVYYEKDGGTHLDLFEARIVFCQYESLWKLQSRARRTGTELPAVRVYDLVIVDEFILICDQSVSLETNRNNLRTNDFVFRDVTERAKRLLFLDKDLANCSRLYDFLFCEMEGVVRIRVGDSLEKAQELVEFHQYTYMDPRLERRVKVATTYDEFMNAFLGVLKDESKRSLVCFRSQRSLESLYDEAVRKGLTFPHIAGDPSALKAYEALVAEGKAPAHHTETDPRKVLRHTRPEGPKEHWTEEQKKTYDEDNKTRNQWCQGASVRIIDGRTPENTKEKMLRNFDSWLCRDPCNCRDSSSVSHGDGKDCRCVFITSAAMVSVSILTRMNNVFLYAADMTRKIAITGPTGRGLAQMLLRARNVDEPAVVLAYFGDGGIGAPRYYDGAKRSAKPWQHCKLFELFQRNYLTKQQRMIETATKPSGWSEVFSGTVMRRFTDDHGRDHRYVIPTSLQLRLIAKTVEQERDYGTGIWWKLSTDFVVTMEDPLPLEERLAKLKKARDGIKQAPPEEVGEKFVANKVNKEDLHQRLVLTELVDWTVYTFNEAVARSNAMAVARSINNLEGAEVKVLGVLVRFPSYMQEQSLRYQRLEGLDEKEAKRQRAELGNRLWKEYQELRKVLPVLDNRQVAFGPISLVGGLEGQQILALEQDAKTVARIAQELSALLGRESFAELDAGTCRGSDDCGHAPELHEKVLVPPDRLAQSADKLKVLCKDLFYAMGGIPKKDVEAKQKKPRQPSGDMKHLLGYYGYTMATDKEASVRRTTGGVKSRLTTYCISKKPDTAFAHVYHDRLVGGIEKIKKGGPKKDDGSDEPKGGQKRKKTGNSNSSSSKRLTKRQRVNE